MGTYLRLTPALRSVLRYLLDTESDVWGLLLAKETGRPTGTIYPLLERLEREGFAYSRWGEDGPGARRRLYALSSKGRDWALARLGTNGRLDLE